LVNVIALVTYFFIFADFEFPKEYYRYHLPTNLDLDLYRIFVEGFDAGFYIIDATDEMFVKI
jgi:hypothetical protein